MPRMSPPMSQPSEQWKTVYKIDVNLHVYVTQRRNVPPGEKPSWVWEATSFMGTRDICSRGYRPTEPEAQAAANEAATLILRLRVLEREPV